MLTPSTSGIYLEGKTIAHERDLSEGRHRIQRKVGSRKWSRFPREEAEAPDPKNRANFRSSFPLLDRL